MPECEQAEAPGNALSAVLALHGLLAGAAPFDVLAGEAVERVSDLLAGAAGLWRLLPHEDRDDEIALLALRHPDAGTDRTMAQLSAGGVVGPHTFIRLVASGASQVRLDGQQVLDGRGLMEDAYREFFTRYPPSAMLLQPLRWRGRTVGVLGISRGAGDPDFDEADTTLLAQVGQVLAVALHGQESAEEQQRLLLAAQQAERRAAHLARTDTLSGLPNRRGFLERLEQELRPGDALLVLDVVGFRSVNSTFGHVAGDVLLLGLADRLERAVPAGALLGHLGGDEFAVLLPGAAGSEREVRALLRSGSQVVEVLGAEVDLGLRAGLAVASAEPLDPAGLLREADVALGRAERDGVVLRAFDPTADAPALERLHEAARLRRALQHDDLVVHYQRVWPLRPDPALPFAVEALVRWPRPDGLLLPGDFLDLARDSGSLSRLNDVVLDQVVQQLQRWAADGRAVCAAVNVPASVLVDGFADRALSALDAAGLPVTALCLEILEGELVQAPARAALAQARESGLRVSVDDFGTGFSALGHVLDLPVDALKLDRSLVSGIATDPRRRALVDACTRFARELELSVVAEGVETEPDLQALQALDVGWVQGFLLHRPSPAASVPL